MDLPRFDHSSREFFVSFDAPLVLNSADAQPLFSQVLVEWLGAAVMCAAEFQPAWMEAHDSNELGGLLGAVL